jgi:demethylmenaquinone methyltransferase/2-methoxy-6-polyprenyl-1,4-benzoquinol methylase
MSGGGKKEMVGRMFDGIAPTYDRLNHLLSLGIDRLWRRRVVRMASGFLRGQDPSTALRLLDVATGTGDLAIALARSLPAAGVTGVDISEGMMARGREKIARLGLGERITLLNGDAERLEFADGEFDCATVAFGVRNFGDVGAGLSEMRRVLRPGGRCLVLEFGEPTVPLFAPLYRFYFHRMLPWIGRMVSRDGGAYGYLPRSVDRFPPPPEFAAMLRRAGFKSVNIRPLTGGVAYIYEAEK